jgi:hypothetical protein
MKIQDFREWNAVEVHYEDGDYEILSPDEFQRFIVEGGDDCPPITEFTFTSYEVEEFLGNI